jgi:hypothetical protein
MGLVVMQSRGSCPSTGQWQHEIYNPGPDKGVSGVKRINAMATLTTEEEEILTSDVSDEALEIAGTVSGMTNFTWGVCTMDQTGCPT